MIARPVRIFRRLLYWSGALACSLVFCQRAQGQVAVYAPAARSNTSGNTMIDSVVGNRHSPVKSQTTATGDLYHIASDGTVTAPNGLIVNPGCPTNGGGPLPEIHSKYRFGFGRRGKGFETVMIGVSEEPARPTSKAAPVAHKTVRRATLNASFGPSNVFVVPHPCAYQNASDTTLTTDAASALAAADGNAFTLAGNRDTVEDIDTARPYLNGDVELVSTPPSGPSSGRVAP